MKTRTKLISLLIFGVLLALGPVWGIIGTVIGMLHAFSTCNQTSPQAETIADGVSFALYTTFVGWIAFFIGIIIIIISAVRIVNPKNKDV